MRKTVKRNRKIKKNRRKTRGGMLGRLAPKLPRGTVRSVFALSGLAGPNSNAARVSSTIPHHSSNLSPFNSTPISESNQFKQFKQFKQFEPTIPLNKEIDSYTEPIVFPKGEQVTLKDPEFKPLYVKMLEILKEEASNTVLRLKKSVDLSEIFREGVKWTFNLPFDFLGRSISFSVFLFLLCNSEQILKIKDEMIVNTCEAFNNGIAAKKNKMKITFNCVKSTVNNNLSDITVRVSDITSDDLPK
jgi:hypothetical protein